MLSTLSCYQTNTREEQSRTVCTATPLFQNQTILTYQIQRRQFVSGLFSPGFFAANETHQNNLLCLYNVRCSSGHLVYFNIVREKLQDLVNGSCVDFIRVDRPSLNRELVTCGSDLERFQGIEAGALSVEFRTDSDVTDCGFFMSAVCFDPSTLNAPGCSIPNVTNSGRFRWKRETQFPQFTLSKLVSHDTLGVVNLLCTLTCSSKCIAAYLKLCAVSW